MNSSALDRNNIHLNIIRTVILYKLFLSRHVDKQSYETVRA